MPQFSSKDHFHLSCKTNTIISMAQLITCTSCANLARTTDLGEGNSVLSFNGKQYTASTHHGFDASSRICNVVRSAAVALSGVDLVFVMVRGPIGRVVDKYSASSVVMP